ncbi:hypothetical protein FHP25_27630 [Vineibacter terrae]|uniref:Uncharacterized protein n=1 Tax=Vineibacter terrae TaxID=2586908 RepID=A0A5C8PF95_9HYPH|nr:hypothetical protein [Vineibacter terrae]TXL72008.1 hypothetical protein FHP25_27630 [Vineibacter terrae]
MLEQITGTGPDQAVPEICQYLGLKKAAGSQIVRRAGTHRHWSLGYSSVTRDPGEQPIRKHAVAAQHASATRCGAEADTFLF